MTIAELIAEVESPRVKLFAATSPGSIYQKWVDLLPELKIVRKEVGNLPVRAADGKPASVDVVDPSVGIRLHMDGAITLSFLPKAEVGTLTLKSLVAMIEHGGDEDDFRVVGI